ncbi:permease prefix domain 1-containing protein [Propionicimonas sp.]|uniref:permease prefix domain 1-containing protein n=1 Tax=Propionicimonas sp. TaxID=1955623 RepID=UPI0039E562DB
MTDSTDTQLAQWRRYLAADRSLATADLDELESHLRDRIDDLEAVGLSDEEAFLIAVRRLGRVDELSREYAREHSERLWKQLVLGGDPAAASTSSGAVAVAFAVLAAFVVKLPWLLGAPADVGLRNAPLLLLGVLAAYFLVRAGGPRPSVAIAVVGFAGAAALVNGYPLDPGSDTLVLTVLHITAALWLIVGVTYVEGRWRSGRARMDLIRFTGEWVIYLALIALGGAVLTALTLGVFAAIGMDAGSFVVDWLLPCGAAGATVVAAWLADAKKSVIENMAPVLTAVFSPLFTAMLAAFVVAAAVQGAAGVSLLDTHREVLIVFDATLIVVLALLLYTISAREASTRARWFDALQLAMILAALVVDLLVLSAMVGRIGVFGASPNKVASLGLNVLLLVNLAGAGWLQLGFLRGRRTHGVLERWQTAYLPVYFVWCVVVAAVLPPLFGFA